MKLLEIISLQLFDFVCLDFMHRMQQSLQHILGFVKKNCLDPVCIRWLVTLELNEKKILEQLFHMK